MVFNSTYGLNQGQPLLQHEVGQDQGGGAADSDLAMDEDPPYDKQEGRSITLYLLYIYTNITQNTSIHKWQPLRTHLLYRELRL